MIKGCERRLVIYKSKNSKYFSEVHFIMKEEIDSKKELRKDIIAEANKIVNESTSQCAKAKKRKSERRSKFLFFFFGIAFSSLFFIILAHFNII